ncbi:MAG: hypothetical protein UMU75_02885 [Halomonas sp.]|nr:hypothetical protein [Halomonas sp.]
MFNRSRQVTCPHCAGHNFWKGDPQPSDALHCRYCEAFVTTYDDYIHDAVRKEAERLIAEFAGGEPSPDLAFLKGTAQPQAQRASA